jgi:hypothetical protein
MPRITEAQIASIVIDYLHTKNNRQATIHELVRMIPTVADLSREDMAWSTTRPNERLWEQRLRNITSHKKSRGNAIHDGLLVSVPYGLALPTEGHSPQRLL